MFSIYNAQITALFMCQQYAKEKQKKLKIFPLCYKYYLPTRAFQLIFEFMRFKQEIILIQDISAMTYESKVYQFFSISSQIRIGNQDQIEAGRNYVEEGDKYTFGKIASLHFTKIIESFYTKNQLSNFPTFKKYLLDIFENASESIYFLGFNEVQNQILQQIIIVKETIYKDQELEENFQDIFEESIIFVEKVDNSTDVSAFCLLLKRGQVYMIGKYLHFINFIQDQVSRNHAYLQTKNFANRTQLLIWDNNSRNGTFKNLQKRKTYTVKIGEIFTIGKYHNVYLKKIDYDFNNLQPKQENEIQLQLKKLVEEAEELIQRLANAPPINDNEEENDQDLISKLKDFLNKYYQFSGDIPFSYLKQNAPDLISKASYINQQYLAKISTSSQQLYDEGYEIEDQDDQAGELSDEESNEEDIEIESNA